MEENELHVLRNLFFLMRDKEVLDGAALAYAKEVIGDILYQMNPNDPFELKNEHDYSFSRAQHCEC